MSSIEIEELRNEVRTQADKTRQKIDKADKQSKGRDNRIASRLDELSKKIEERLSEIDGTTYYVVVRTVPLNTDKRFMGPTIIWLYPGDEVELIERNAKWIKVLAYDASTGETHLGWVLKKYLRLVK